MSDIRYKKKMSESDDSSIDQDSPKKVTQKLSQSRQVKKIDPITKKVLKKYNQITKAAEDVGISRRAIQLVLTGQNKTAGGYIWEYIDDSCYEDDMDLTKGRKIYDYDNYYVFPNSKVYNALTSKFLKHNITETGRYYVTLCKNGKKQNTYVQLLVADHWLPNKPNSKSTVMHIDGNQSNNDVKNLKWMESGQSSVKFHRILYGPNKNTESDELLDEIEEIKSKKNHSENKKKNGKKDLHIDEFSSDSDT